MFTRSRQPPHVMGTRVSVPAWMGHQVAASLSSEERRSSCLPHTPPTGPALRGALPRSADPSSYWNRLQRCPVLGEPGPPSGPRGTNAAAQTCSHSCSPPPPHCPELGLASSPLPPPPPGPHLPRNPPELVWAGQVFWDRSLLVTSHICEDFSQSLDGEFERAG